MLAGFDFADEGLVARDDLGHAGFDGGEVGLGEGCFAVDVVEEALVGGGAVAELGLGEELEDGGGHDVRGGVADDLEGGFVLLLQEPEGDVFGERGGEVDDALGGGVDGGVVHGLRGVGRRVGRGVVDAAFGLVDVEAGEGFYLSNDYDRGEARGDRRGDVEGGGAGCDFADAAVGKLDANCCG